MSETTEIIKTVAPIAAPFVTSIVATFVTPRLERLSKFLKRNRAESMISVESKFEEYLQRSFETHSCIPILIFQNQLIKLEDIYIPLTVRSERGIGYGLESFLIDKYPKNFLPRYKKVLIRDTAGMGKSTLMKYLFLSCLKEQKGIPIFIELRRLNGDDSIIDFIHGELNPINDEFDQNLILNLIKDGNFIFFLDGYDEISQREREKVTLKLQNFISKTGNNLFIMTSRPETSLASFPDFMGFDIKPLELKEAFNLLRKYDQNGVLSAEIISKLKGDTLKNVWEFLGNPLLVSLLYKSYDYKRVIPFKKHIFYRQVYDALFDSHDLTKPGWEIREKKSQLDSDSFHKVLRALGFITIKHGIEYDKDAIISFLTKAKAECPKIDFKESDFLHDLLQTVSLFAEEGNYYRWLHKSIQDYFTALFIKEDRETQKPDILRKIVLSQNNDKYENVLDLYYDIDLKSFRNVIIYDYINEFIEHYNKRFDFREHKNEVVKYEKLLNLFTFDASYILFGKMAEMQDAIMSPLALELELRSFIKKKKLPISGKLLLFDKDELCVIVNKNYLITTLLSRRNDDLFIDLSKYIPSIQSDFVHQVNSTVFLGNHLFLTRDKTFDESDGWTFSLLKHIYARTRKQAKLLDIKKCRSMKLEIEAEIKRETTSDLYDDL